VGKELSQAQVRQLTIDLFRFDPADPEGFARREAEAAIAERKADESVPQHRHCSACGSVEGTSPTCFACKDERDGTLRGESLCRPMPPPVPTLQCRMAGLLRECQNALRNTIPASMDALQLDIAKALDDYDHLHKEASR